MNRLYIGIDIGGTSMVAARFSESEMLDQSEVPSGADRPAEEIMESLFEAIDKVITDEVVGIGIGMPGFMDTVTGEILQINNIPSFNGFSVKQAVEKKFGLPTFQNNDANCFALGETWFGAGKGYTNLVGVTLGTGLGGGIIINRKIHTGLVGGAGELGCVPFRGGIVEDLCSAALFANKYSKTGAELYNEAKSGNKESLMVFDELARNIGELLNIIMYILAPEAFIIGGSVAKAWEFLEKPLREEVDKFPVELISKKVKLLPAQLDNAGLYGAAALCISQMQ
ncbi:MAG: ROK family protein [Bacteroidales bacterium]|nr:ROK family protein [Bacteroidales bacterium]